jgi:predicted esterase
MPLEEIGNEIEDKDLSSINLFMGNGIQDPVVAIARAEKTFKNLTDLGITPQFKKYNAEHTISYECLQDVLSFLINNNT